MNAHLTQNLDLVASAPKGLLRLKELVLELVVTGRLTANASPGWEVLALEDVCQVIDPQPSHRTPPEVENGVPYIGMGDIDSSGGIDFSGARKVSWSVYQEHRERYQLAEGDLVFGKIGTLGKVTKLPMVGEYTLSANVILIQPNKNRVLPDFVSTVLKSPSFMREVMARSVATSQSAFGIKKLRKMLIPVPPIAEQQLVVAKSDELMKLCDRLETQQLDAEVAHRMLVKTLLDELVQARDQYACISTWDLIEQNFDILFTSESAVDALKQSVLQLAAKGRLSKSTLEWSEGKASEICEKVQSGKTPKEGFIAVPGVPFLKVYNIVNQRIDFQYRPQYVPEHFQAGQLSNSRTLPGDVLMNIVGPPLGKVAIVPDDYPEWNINQALTLFRPSSRVTAKWLYYYLCSGVTIAGINTRGTAGQDNISLTQCRNMLISVPPISEQVSIVEKLDRILAICDRLKAGLSEIRVQQAAVSLSLIEQALLDTKDASKSDVMELVAT